MPTPLYDPLTAQCAFQLRYSWTAWPSAGRFPKAPDSLLDEIAPRWEEDGLRVLESRWMPEFVQILFSTTPTVAPVRLATCAKGRLDHALRMARLTTQFSRKVSVRSVGDATRQQIESYIASQVAKKRFLDPQFEAELAQLAFADPKIDLSAPTESARGRYWYNLHLVLVTDGRYQFNEVALLRRMRDCCLQVAHTKGHLLARLSVMPDHVHLAIRAKIDESPVDLAFSYQNNLAYMLQKGRIWRDSFYVGTFGDYGMGAVRSVVVGGDAR
ncbi:MAG: transposase [Planctomycetales bacterium]